MEVSCAWSRWSYEGNCLLRFSYKISAGDLVALRDSGIMPESIIASIVFLPVVSFALASLARLGRTDTDDSLVARKLSLKGLLDRALPGVRLVIELWMLSTYLEGVIFAGLEPRESWELGDFSLDGRPDCGNGLKRSSESRTLEGENGLVGTSGL